MRIFLPSFAKQQAEAEIYAENMRFAARRATDGLRTAKALHDRIEALYNPAIDYNAIYSYADELGERLLKRYCTLAPA